MLSENSITLRPLLVLLLLATFAKSFAQFYGGASFGRSELRFNDINYGGYLESISGNVSKLNTGYSWYFLSIELEGFYSKNSNFKFGSYSDLGYSSGVQQSITTFLKSYGGGISILVFPTNNVYLRLGKGKMSTKFPEYYALISSHSPGSGSASYSEYLYQSNRVSASYFDLGSGLNFVLHNNLNIRIEIDYYFLRPEFEVNYRNTNQVWSKYNTKSFYSFFNAGVGLIWFLKKDCKTNKGLVEIVQETL